MPTPDSTKRAAQWYLDNWPLVYGAQIADANRRMESLAALLDEVRAEERERCAKIAEGQDACQTEYWCDTGDRAAAAIRGGDDAAKSQ